jgi:chemotaxis protein CheC
MTLTENQNDALSELINISFSRAAASLSELTGRRVLITAPEVKMIPMHELPDALSAFMADEVATVHQIFSGPVAGDVFLLFNHRSAATLAGLLTETQAPGEKLDASLAEALTEIGNILLNACLGMFGNLLDVRVTFSVPRWNLETLHTFLNGMKVGKDGQEELQYSVVAYTSFEVETEPVKGYLVIVLSVTSLEKLLAALQKLG